MLLYYRLVSLMDQPPPKKDSCLEVISQWNVPDQWTIPDLTPRVFVNCAKRQAQACLSLKSVLQSIMCFACGANSVPKDPCLACLCFVAVSTYEAFTMRNACVNDYPNALSNVQLFIASYNIT